MDAYEVVIEKGESFKIESPCLIQYTDTRHPDAIVLEVEPISLDDGPVDFVIEVGDKAHPYGVIVKVSKWPVSSSDAMRRCKMLTKTTQYINVRKLSFTVKEDIGKITVYWPDTNVSMEKLADDVAERLISNGFKVRIDET